MSKKLLIPTFLIVGLFTVALLSGSTVLAQDTGTINPIAARIAQRFKLNESDVQSVFNEVRDEHQADMYAKFADRLSEDVASGKITEDQKKEILAKYEEIHDSMLGLSQMTPAERREKARELHQSLADWASQNGIALDELGPFGKGPAFGGMHRMMR